MPNRSDSTEAEKTARERLAEVVSESIPQTADGWIEHNRRLQEAQNALGRALGHRD